MYIYTHSIIPNDIPSISVQDVNSAGVCHCSSALDGFHAGHRFLYADLNGQRIYNKYTLWLFNIAMENHP